MLKIFNNIVQLGALFACFFCNFFLFFLQQYMFVCEWHCVSFSLKYVFFMFQKLFGAPWESAKAPFTIIMRIICVFAKIFSFFLCIFYIFFMFCALFFQFFFLFFANIEFVWISFGVLYSLFSTDISFIVYLYVVKEKICLLFDFIGF